MNWLLIIFFLVVGLVLIFFSIYFLIKGKGENHNIKFKILGQEVEINNAPLTYLALGGVMLIYPTKQIFWKDQGPMTLAVNVHVKKGKEDLSLSGKGNVKLTFHGEPIYRPINPYGQAFFQNMHLGDTIKLAIDFSEPYKAVYPDSNYIIEDNHISLECYLAGLDKVLGYVRVEGHPSSKARVGIETYNLWKNTDSTGYYEINIPDNLQSKEYSVKFENVGYKSWTESFHPQTGETCDHDFKKQERE